jgi:hypothetical protein
MNTPNGRTYFLCKVALATQTLLIPAQAAIQRQDG